MVLEEGKVLAHQAVVLVPKPDRFDVFAAPFPDGTEPLFIPRCACGRWDCVGACGPYAGSSFSAGLPLWWNAAPLRVNWKRAVSFGHFGKAYGEPLTYNEPPTLAEVLHVARLLESAGLCRVLVFDLVDSRLVEVSP